jgi:hypothetical protein
MGMARVSYFIQLKANNYISNLEHHIHGQYAVEIVKDAEGKLNFTCIKIF